MFVAVFFTACPQNNSGGTTGGGTTGGGTTTDGGTGGGGTGGTDQNQPYVRPERPSGLALTNQYFPDNDFRAYLMSNEIKLGSYGDLLTDEKLDSIKSLNIPSDVTNLEGLQWFYGLQDLTVRFNKNIKEIELRNFEELLKLDMYGCDLVKIDLSKNTKLTSLTLNSNSNLSSLDVSNNPNLTELNLSVDNGSIKSLDLSNNKKLTELTLDGLTGLDVQAADALANSLYSSNTSKKIHCGGYYDTYKGVPFSRATVKVLKTKKWDVKYYTLDPAGYFPFSGLLVLDEKHFPDKAMRDKVISSISGAKEGDIVYPLQYIGLRFPDTVKEVDLSGIEYLEDKLSYLIISANTTVSNLYLDKNTGLEELEIGGCNVTSGSFDFTENTLLKWLICNNVTLNGSKLSSLKLASKVYTFTLDCSNNALKSLDLSQVYHPKWVNERYTCEASLNLSYNNLTSIKFADSQYYDMSNRGAYELTGLDLSHNQLTTLDFQNNNLLDAYSQLNFSCNKLTNITGIDTNMMYFPRKDYVGPIYLYGNNFPESFFTSDQWVSLFYMLKETKAMVYVKSNYLKNLEDPRGNYQENNKFTSTAADKYKNSTDHKNVTIYEYNNSGGSYKLN